MSKPLEDAWAWLKSQLNTNAPVLAVLGFLVLLAGAWGRQAIVDVTDDRVQPVRVQVEKLSKAQDRYEDDVHELRKDVRELYRVTPFVRPSPRLEAPLVVHDGGEP